MVAKFGREVEKAKRRFLFARQDVIHSVQTGRGVRPGLDVRSTGVECNE